MENGQPTSDEDINGRIGIVGCRFYIGFDLVLPLFLSPPHTAAFTASTTSSTWTSVSSG
jgi:hypothetical protein